MRKACEPVSKRPFPGRSPQALVALQHRSGCHRVGRMQIDERTQRFRPFPERMERGMIEVLPVGVAVDHGAAEPQLAHRALELVGGRDGVLHRKVCETGIAVGSLADLTGEEIVGLARFAAGRAAVPLGLHARSREREHAAGNAAAIHGAEPQLAEIGQAREELVALRRREVHHRRRPIVLEAGTQEVLLQCDLRDHAAPSGCSPRMIEIFLYRILVEAYQWVSQQASLRPPVTASFDQPRRRPRCKSRASGGPTSTRVKTRARCR